MRIVQLTPGAGGMFCGSCLRDNALVAQLRQWGHSVTLLPLYLPLKTDEADQSRGAPVFFGGISVYLEQKSALFARLPKWLHHWLAAPGLLRLVGTAAAKTRPEAVGELTLSMLRGELGNQARELDELVAWLREHERPEVVSISNVLLAGIIRRVRADLGCKVAVTLQGEDAFLDGLPRENRQAAWDLVAERVAEADIIISPSAYYADRMAARLNLPRTRIHVVPNGLRLEGWEVAPTPPQPPVIGYLARLCPEKGLALLVEAYLRVRRAGRVPGVRLHLGGSMGPTDEPHVEEAKAKLRAEGYLGEVEFHPNLEYRAKQAFFRGLSVLSVPAHYGETFGLYLIEAMAAGVPFVQPRTAAFPEIAEASGGGLLCAPNDSQALADQLEKVLLDPELARRLGRAGRAAVERVYNVEAAARAILEIYSTAVLTR